MKTEHLSKLVFSVLMLDYIVHVFNLSLMHVVCTADPSLLSSQVKLSVWYMLPCWNELLHRLFKILQTGDLQFPPLSPLHRNAPLTIEINVHTLKIRMHQIVLKTAPCCKLPFCPDLHTA